MIRTRLTGQSELDDGWGDGEIDGLAEVLGSFLEKEVFVQKNEGGGGINKIKQRDKKKT